MAAIKILQVGLGPLGIKTVQFAVARGFKIIAAVDPAHAGKDVGELCGLKKMGVKIQGTLKEAMKSKKPDVAVLTTVSSLKKLVSQVEEVAQYKLPMVSTCEELSFPWKTQKAVAKKLDTICKKKKVSLLGTGVNPGYLMDYLPTVTTAVCQNVKAIKVWRVQDATFRRIPFQQKIGAALNLDEFKKKELEGTLRHVGLPESVDFIAHQMGWKLTRKTESLNPVIAEKEITSGYKPIPKGFACGVEQVGRGFVGEEEVITLYFKAAVGEEKSYDSIEVIGEPNISSTIEGGVNGDVATCAITINSIKSILKAQPGLVTMADIPSVSWSK